MKPNQERDVYYIPPNFLTSGRLFGGAIRIRNAIEAGILVVLTGLPIIQLPLSLTTRIIILCLITLPLGIFGIIGIEGDALSEFVISWVKWLKNRRILYRSDAAVDKPAPAQKQQGVSHQPPEELDIKIKKAPAKHKKKRRKPNAKPKASMAKKPTKTRKKESFTEDLIPVKDIRNGIVHLTDGRYIKILEVEPINFLLRSAREQKNIIFSFASWLKISPVKLQIKVVTKKADISKHLNAIERDMDKENDPKCRELQQDYYNLIKTIGSREANLVTGQRAGDALEGAVFEITQARSGAVVGYIVTDARGVAASGPLPLGRYYITEVSAPKYYQLSGEKMEAEIEYPNQIIKLSAYNKSANLGVTIKKTGNYEVQPGQVMSYDFSGIANTSNVALNSFFWHDRIPTDAARAISISTGTYNQRMYYKVTFKTNLNDYRTLASNLLTTNNYSLSLNATTLGLVQGEYVTDVRFEFGTVPSGFASVVKPTMRVQVLGTVSNGYQIINRADVGGQYLNEWQTAKATWVTTVRRFQNTSLPKTGY